MRLDDNALNILFRQARSHNKWQARQIDEELLHELYALTKMAPTSANTSPARFIFVVSKDAKAQLLPHIIDSNIEKVKTASAAVIIAYDIKFYDLIPQLFPHQPEARDWFCHDEALAAETALRNSSLQGAYFMLAARALGLDVGPISGFDPAGVNAAFFPDGQYKANFICNIGYGDADGLFDRAPRLDFDAACKIV